MGQHHRTATKEPALSRHAAARTGRHGSTVSGAGRHERRTRSKGFLLALALVCAGMLAAVPLTLMLIGGSGSGDGGGSSSSRDSDGVFAGNGDTRTGGPAGITTEASRTPAPGDTPLAPAGETQADGAPAGAAGGAQNGGGGAQGGAAGAGSGSGGGAPAGGGSGPAGGGGAPAGSGGSGWTAGGQPAPAPAPAQQQPPAQQPAPQQPAPQQPPAQQPPKTDAEGRPCPCQLVNGVLTSLASITDPLGDAVGGLLGK